MELYLTTPDHIIRKKGMAPHCYGLLFCNQRQFTIIYITLDAYLLRGWDKLWIDKILGYTISCEHSHLKNVYLFVYGKKIPVFFFLSSFSHGVIEEKQTDK